jgi:fermentation-respiration switch protein FrsA (DUF1100 family)
MDERFNIEFLSGTEGGLCRGWLYPSGYESAPIIVMAHGLGGVKEMRLDAYAERFTANGYTCLVFDYRYVGTSDGQPRQVIEVSLQLEDWASAISHARKLRPSSPIVLWGSSLAGGHVLAAGAANGQIAAIISQCPHTSGPAAVSQLDFRTIARITGLALLDLAAKALKRPPVMVPLAARPGSTALMNGPGDYEVANKLLETAGIAKPPNWAAARIGLIIATYSPGTRARELQCPILFCLCSKDQVAPASVARRYAKEARMAEIAEYPVGHFDIYMDEPFERVIVDQIEFLRKHVPPSP